MSVPRPSRAALAWFIVVAALFIGFTAATWLRTGSRVDVPMRIAVNLVHGDPSLDESPGGLDTVTRDGRSYHVVGLGPIWPYLPFTPFPGAWPLARWITSLAFGILAVALAWPLAEQYGPGGGATPWLATLSATGTLLLPLAIQGNFYYLAHVEAAAFTFAALIEWAGRRRGWLVGMLLGLAALARPTILLAAIPFGVFLVVRRGGSARALAEFGLPIAVVVGITGLWNLVRFGSPLESGYGSAILNNELLIRARQAGVFSLRHVGDNLAVLLAKGFDVRESFPFVTPSRYGHSILLTSPALISAINAGIRDGTARVLWIAAALVTVPLLLYYGGAGYVTYGYRYAMDVVPFVLALVAMGARKQFGGTEKALIVASVALCVYGAVWAVASATGR